MRNLASAHRRFRAIAKEGLICKASTSPLQIFELVETLQRNPTLVHRMTHLRFAPLTEEIHDKMHDAATMYRERLGNDVYTAYCDIVEKAYPRPDNEAWKRAIKEVGDFYSIGLSLLIAQSSGLTALTLGTNMLDSMPLVKRLFRCEDKIPAAPWVFQVRSILRARLKSITVYEDHDKLVGYEYSETSLDLQDFALKPLVGVPGIWITKLLANRALKLLGKAAGDFLSAIQNWQKNSDVEVRTTFGNLTVANTCRGSENEVTTEYTRGNLPDAVIYLIRCIIRTERNPFVTYALGYPLPLLHREGPTLKA
ncbi:hypothetical protein CC86DRAFT_385047 [Ophiobolus disseminans]|uniref:Uncharacterized protein n=1 Tax=Ophiobolus disseminans TaxID=1469910 RepID=A0A6A6ZP26_9PLEO|nr:hypothetical protein CC86DRAFT_385047 [Ophiobolus disseminans]